MRKVMAWVLLAVLLVSILPLQVLADYENTYSNTGDQRADIIGVALTQVGYDEGPGNDTKYGTWAGNPNTEWCGWFVSWCARQAGVPTSVLRTNGRAVPSGFGLTSYYTSSQYTPRSGDLFFKKSFGHVGLVYYVDGSYFYTLEGNTSTSGWEGTSVMSRRRVLSEYYFASPAYTSDSGSTTPPAHSHNYQKHYESAHPHKEYYKCDCGASYYTGDTRKVDGCSSCNSSSSSGSNPEVVVPTECTHSYGDWKSSGSSNHRKTCTKCGDGISQSHEWVDEDLTQPPTCQDKGEMLQRCSVCKATRKRSVDKLDEHIYKDWIIADEQTHIRKCEFCDDTQQAEHILFADEQGNPTWQTNGVSHWYQCADCGMKSQSAVHAVITGQDEATHWQYCDVCDRIITPAQEHTYGETMSKDEEKHWQLCTQCGAKKDEAPHQYQLIQWEEDLQVESCTVCGQLSGNVIQQEPEEILPYVVECLTDLGKAIVPEGVLPESQQVDWNLIVGIAAVVLTVAVPVTVVCLIAAAANKKKKKVTV